MSRILVTGAPGFVGAAAIRALTGQGDDVVAVAQPGTTTERLDGLPVTTVAVDLDDGASVAEVLARTRPEIVLHAAWYANPADYLSSPNNLAALRATVGLFQAAAATGCRRFVGIGTCLEYATSDRPRSEESQCNPRTLYASCKNAGWLICRALALQTRSSFAWARLFYLYGSDENPGRILPALVSAVHAKRPFPTTTGEQVRDYLHIDDAGMALAFLCHNSHEGVLNVASGKATRLVDFIASAADLLDASELVHAGELPMRPDEEMFMVGDVTRLRGLGFAPRHSTLQAGLDHTLKNWRNR
jgi:nucleoside-diphosphate-sugar epimerase